MNPTSHLLVVDLHTHTRCSDGRLAPAALVAKAKEAGLAALAITDHDCIDGLPEAQEAGADLGVEVVPGVELSVSVGAREVHLLGYNFDPDHASLRAYLRRYRTVREERGRAMVAQLQRIGVPLSFAAVHAQANGGVVARPHVAYALIEAGFVATYEEAFEAYLGDHAPAAVAKPRFPAAQALALLHDAGGVGVLAHPGHWTEDVVIMTMIRAGLDGIEVVHPSHDDTLVDYYTRLARDFFLLTTGGSDYHGYREQDEEHFGQYVVGYDRLERLRRRPVG